MKGVVEVGYDGSGLYSVGVVTDTDVCALNDDVTRFPKLEACWYFPAEVPDAIAVIWFRAAAVAAGAHGALLHGYKS